MEVREVQLKSMRAKLVTFRSTADDRPVSWLCLPDGHDVDLSIFGPWILNLFEAAPREPSA